VWASIATRAEILLGISPHQPINDFRVGGSVSKQLPVRARGVQRS
jgi:hypothetical protein